nr:MAG TPA: hypothetical protein [Caudoviricetes sp.]
MISNFIFISKSQIMNFIFNSTIYKYRDYRILPIFRKLFFTLPRNFSLDFWTSSML